MEYLSHSLVSLVTRRIEDSDFYPTFIDAVESQLTSSHDDSTVVGFRNCIDAVLEEPDFKCQLSNTVHHYLQKHPQVQTPWKPLSIHKEPLDYIRKAQLSWEKRIFKSLNSICKELNIVLAKKRPVSEQKELEANWHELSTQETDLSRFRPVYAAKDFLDVITSLRNPNFCGYDDLRFGTYWGSIRVPLASKDITTLRRDFREISALDKYHFGLGDEDSSQLDSCRVKRKQLETAVLESNYAILARDFAKCGCPSNSRAEIWCQILGIKITDKEKLIYEQLKYYVFQHDLMIDKLNHKDVKLTATNDDQYFVFQNYLLQVVLLFSRDTFVLAHFTHTSASPPKALLRGKVDEVNVVYPPSGIIPFHGFSMYVAPLCYLYDDPIKLYFVFREIYTRYFFRLHSVTSHPQGILSLSLLFERLLQTHEEELCEHFRHHRIDPLRVAFRWLMKAFSGHLVTDQVLLLWDTILAYDNLECLAVLAVSIIWFRKTSLLQVRTQSETDAVLADLSSIKVIPLLRAFLTSNKEVMAN